MHIVSSAKLHSTVFIGRTNLQMDLDPAKRPGMRLLADDQSQMLFVEYKGEVGRVPYTDIVSMIPKDQAMFRRIFSEEYTKLEITPVAAQTTASEEIAKDVTIPTGTRKIVRQSAQVSAPTGHVHAGPGAGKTHD